MYEKPMGVIINFLYYNDIDLIRKSEIQEKLKKVGRRVAHIFKNYTGH